MSQIQLTDPVFYKNGEAGHSKVVGFESQVTRVARYTFVSPPSGATELSLLFDGVSKGAGIDNSVRFAITTDPDSHRNAGADATYTGSLQVNLPNYTAGGSAYVRLAPNVTYYLWVFPGQNAWGWYYWPATGTVTTAGFSEGVPEAPDGFLGENIPITIHSSPDYTHRLTWSFGTLSGIIGEALGDSVTWTPPFYLAEAIPGSSGGSCVITCYSYQGGAQIGSAQSCVITLSVPASLAPRVSVAVTDPTEAAAFGCYIEKVSKLELSVTSELFYGASQVSTAITLDGAAYTGSVLSSGSHSLTVTVTDSRGLAGHWSEELSVTPYAPPRLELHASRCRIDGTADDTADHALVTCRGETTQMAGNTAALTLTYGKTSLDIPVATGVFETTTIIPADPNETLLIKARIVDALKGTTRSMTLSTGYPTMEFLAGGKGIAFGKVADSEGFHCAMDAVFSGKVMDAQGRAWVARYDLTPVTGMYLTNIYSRVLELLGAGFLHLRFTCNRNRSAGDLLYSCQLPITENITVTDLTGNYSLTLTPTGVITPNALPTGTYTFSTLLY